MACSLTMWALPETTTHTVHYVEITAQGFNPQQITISEGENVTWVSRYKYTSILTSTGLHAEFITKQISINEEFSNKYDVAGKYPYIDNNGFKGNVTVLSKKRNRSW